METFKISVEVNVNLSESTQNFFKQLFLNSACGCKANTVTDAPTPAPAPAPKPTPATKPTPQPVVPVPTKPAATTAPSAPAAPAASSVTIEDVRKMLANKVNEHRDVIKQKLNELGAPSVTKLDPTKYDEMYNFLESL